MWGILRGRLLAVLVLMSLQDAAIFACQRLADLATNYGGRCLLCTLGSSTRVYYSLWQLGLFSDSTTRRELPAGQRCLQNLSVAL